MDPRNVCIVSEKGIWKEKHRQFVFEDELPVFFTDIPF